ncbi:MAG: ABC transporter ATP-binding protein [Treponema sp.]|jgi:iron complex transport system ATP-binding protein|nr:ABC transporter ATP-binding protein [Treponema sp.]
MGVFQEKGKLMLEIKNLSAGYGGPDVIHDIQLQADEGEMLCIVGPNGCGKTTLLKSIARLLKYRGSVLLNSLDIAAVPRKELAKKIAMLGQLSQIYFPYSVYDTVSLGRYAYSSGFLKNLSKEDEEIINDTINWLGLTGEKDRMITELSGGQLQRVFLARTIVQNPDIILLDEPTNHLDLKHQVELLHYLLKWARDNNKIVIGVLHDLNLVHTFGDKAALMSEGKIAAHGKPEEVLDGETLKTIYDIDIKKFMIESLEKWKSAGEYT